MQSGGRDNPSFPTVGSSGEAVHGLDFRLQVERLHVPAQENLPAHREIDHQGVGSLSHQLY